MDNKEIIFCSSDPLVNLRDLAVFAHYCGICIQSDSTRIITKHSRHRRRRVDTGTAPSLAIALAPIIHKLPNMMDVRQKYTFLSKFETIVITNVYDDLVNRMLWDILAYTSNLTTLVLRGCRIDDATIYIIANSCPNLAELDLRECSLITDAAISAVIIKCKKLKFVGVARTSIGLDILKFMLERIVPGYTAVLYISTSALSYRI